VIGGTFTPLVRHHRIITIKGAEIGVYNRPSAKLADVAARQMIRAVKAWDRTQRIRMVRRMMKLSRWRF